MSSFGLNKFHFSEALEDHLISGLAPKTLLCTNTSSYVKSYDDDAVFMVKTNTLKSFLWLDPFSSPIIALSVVSITDSQKINNVISFLKMSNCLLFCQYSSCKKAFKVCIHSSKHIMSLCQSMFKHRCHTPRVRLVPGGERLSRLTSGPLFPGPGSLGRGQCSGPVLPVWELSVGALGLWSATNASIASRLSPRVRCLNSTLCFQLQTWNCLRSGGAAS